MRAIFALLIAFCISGPAYAASCQQSDLPTIKADQLVGVKTKWRVHRGRGPRESIEPDLEGLSPAQWMAALESQGVNLAELNVDPREKLSQEPVADNADLQAYLKAYATPKSNRSAEQAAAIERFNLDFIAEQRYTPAQRVEVLMDFLSRMEKAKADGEIKGSVRFILHQRLWFKPGDRPRKVRVREGRIVSFATDMAEVINRAREKCLDHWIAGVRLGENGNPDMSSYVPLLPRLAEAINERTDGWLHSHFFLANGGGMGAEFSGISNVAGAFFKAMSKQTSGFAFGYKVMQMYSKELRFIPNAMAASTCASNRRCDVNSSRDWSYYLGQSLGFEELKDTIRKYHAAYPAFANVVFVGESSDSLVLLTAADRNGDLKDVPSFTALKQLWPHEAGWRGRVFMNGFISRDDIPAREHGNPDSGYALFLSENGAKPLRRSIAAWKEWPG